MANFEWEPADMNFNEPTVEPENKGWVETRSDGSSVVHWFDEEGNEHINGMGVVLPDDPN